MVSSASDAKTNRPSYLEIAARLRARIESGELQAGQRSPSFAMMRAQGVSQGAMERAYALLIAEGIVKSAAGSGVYVAPPRDLKPKPRTNVIGIPGQKEGYENSAYGAPMLSGIQEVAYEANCGVLLTRDFETAKLAMMDGVLSVGPRLAGGHLPPTMPWVSLLWPSNEVPSLVVDEVSGIRIALEHLLRLGHRCIAYLVVRWGEGFEHDRHHAYRDYLSAAHIDWEERWVRPLYTWGDTGDFDPAQGFIGHGYSSMKKWLSEGWSELGCTAILAHNDEAAVGIIRALVEAGLRVPHDVSVVGFDGTSAAAHATPTLTTIEVPLREIGAQGTRLLLNMIENDRRSDEIRQTLPVRLRIGNSTASPPRMKPSRSR